MTKPATRPILLAMLCATALGGCGDTEHTADAPEDGAGAADAAAASDGPPPGYERFEAPPVEVPPDSSADWAQWVGGPLDQDYDVLDINGTQSRGGHHAILYATSEAQPVGFTRLWRDSDQLTTRLMGGIGGEGGARAVLPPGVVFRVKQGSYLVMQTHYLNASEETIVGRSVLDMKLTPVDPDHRVASIMASTDTAVELAPGESRTMDVTCPVEQDLQFIQISNHMHEYGTSVFTEVTDPAGTRREIKTDPEWSYDWALNPNFASFPVDDPLVVTAGSMLRTQCTWHNTTDGSVKFPAEMCVFFGFVLNDSDLYCTSGRWSATRDGADAGVAVDPGSAATEDACLGDGDQTIMDDAAFEQRSTECATPCAFDPDVAGCTTQCFVDELGLSPACAACNGNNVACTVRQCVAQCAADSTSPDCRACVEANCLPAYRRCTGG